MGSKEEKEEKQRHKSISMTGKRWRKLEEAKTISERAGGGEGLAIGLPICASDSPWSSVQNYL